ncbi:hypothetical protein [Streptomyces candidus]|uniref:Signal transduction histidine kinase n=1 Tax=Streptomyces candidus TaxID=67283 RepID=A0A7X0HLZ0_9ACTN|nr:hypothetical protein [Streptomyces candidus]MBB6440106.1 signal transduction histidine kinase [Streptomyces candidus]
MATNDSIGVIRLADHQSRPLSQQTRRAYLAEFMSARSASDRDRVTELVLDAIELDIAHPDEPRLMDELRGLSAEAVAA